MTRALRALAVLLAIAALIDPAFAGRRSRPAAVDIRAEPSPPAAAIRARLAEDLRNEIAVDTGEPPAAVVVIGNASGASLPEGVPISLVSVAPLGGPNVRVVRAAPPEPALPGQEVVLGVQFEAIGLAGRSSTIDLEQDGVRLARVEHPWTATRSASRPPSATRRRPPAFRGSPSSHGRSPARSRARTTQPTWRSSRPHERCASRPSSRGRRGPPGSSAVRSRPIRCSTFRR